MEYTVYSIKYKVCSIQYTLCSIQYTLYNVQYTVYSIQYTVYSIQYTAYSIQSTVYRYKANSTPDCIQHTFHVTQGIVPCAVCFVTVCSWWSNIEKCSVCKRFSAHLIKTHCKLVLITLYFTLHIDTEDILNNAYNPNILHSTQCRKIAQCSYSHCRLHLRDSSEWQSCLMAFVTLFCWTGSGSLSTCRDQLLLQIKCAVYNAHC